MMKYYCKRDDYIDGVIYREMYRSSQDFGAWCPDNWEEIGEALRKEVGRRTDKFIEEYGDIPFSDCPEFEEICRKVWEDYCEGRIPDFPESIFEEIDNRRGNN